MKIKIIANKNMKLNEIKIRGIYKASLKIQFRGEKEIRECELFVRVAGKTSNDCVEVTLLGETDQIVHYLEPHQLSSVE